jgi:hypothetical protein
VVGTLLKSEDRMTDEKKRKKAAQAIQAMLELDGIKSTVKDISVKIEGENLTDLMKLKDKLANDMRSTTEEPATGSNDRRRVIGDFVVTNWDLLKDNEVVKTALLNAYCMGRYKKEQRETMAQELLGRVGAKPEQKTEIIRKVEKTEEAKPETQETETKDEVLDHRQYTF